MCVCVYIVYIYTYMNICVCLCVCCVYTVCSHSCHKYPKTLHKFLNEKSIAGLLFYIQTQLIFIYLLKVSTKEGAGCQETNTMIRAFEVLGSHSLDLQGEMKALVFS